MANGAARRAMMEADFMEESQGTVRLRFWYHLIPQPLYALDVMPEVLRGAKQEEKDVESVCYAQITSAEVAQEHREPRNSWRDERKPLKVQ